MNLAVINKNINKENGKADKELEHSAGHLGTHEGIRVFAPDPSFDNIERKEGNRSKGYITDEE